MRQHRCTRKLSWRKGKRATAVRVWRPLAKKSKFIDATNRYPQPISNFLLTVNSNRGGITYRLQDIFAYVANVPWTRIAATSIKPRYCTSLLQCSGAGLSHDRSANQRAAASLLLWRSAIKGVNVRRIITSFPRCTSIASIPKFIIKPIERINIGRV